MAGCGASNVGAMIVGFTWAGWVTGGTAQEMAGGTSEDTVARRLAPMRVVLLKQDVRKDQKPAAQTMP